MSTRSRHIPEPIKRQLLEEARGRCCLCRELVLEGSDRHLDVEEVLEKHHIVHFGDGGAHEADNLLVVDPTCHRLVHRKREEYSDDALRAAKEKWKSIAEILPKTILYDGPRPRQLDEHSMRLISLPFAFETYGLKFQVIAPDSLTVGEFSTFLKSKVVDPVAEYDGNVDFVESSHFTLSHSGHAIGAYPTDLALREIELEDELDLNLHVHIHVVAKEVEGEFVTLQVAPSQPDAGHSYLVTLENSRLRDFSAMVDVVGTDGYRLSEERQSEDGRITLRIPGASTGIEDSIVARGEFGTMRLHIVFGADQDSPRPSS